MFWSSSPSLFLAMHFAYAFVSAILLLFRRSPPTVSHGLLLESCFPSLPQPPRPPTTTHPTHPSFQILRAPTLYISPHCDALTQHTRSLSSPAYRWNEIPSPLLTLYESPCMCLCLCICLSRALVLSGFLSLSLTIYVSLSS